MAAGCLALSPGEVQRYERETARRLRSERLYCVRQQENGLAVEMRRQYDGRKQQEQQRQQTADVHAKLEAKKAKLTNLLAEQALCDASRGAAKRAASEQRRQRKTEAASRKRLEAVRRDMEAQRASDALKQIREERLVQSLAEKEYLDKLWRARATENRRAQEAAEGGREALAAQKRAERKAELSAREVAKLSPRRVRVTNPRGHVDYSKTYFHVVSHASGSKEPCVVAEFDRPLSPAPPPLTETQILQADTRSRAATAKLADQRIDAELEKRLAAEEVRHRTEKIQRVVSAQAAAAPRAPMPKLTWGVLDGLANTQAEAEINKIFAALPEDAVLFGGQISQDEVGEKHGSASVAVHSANETKPGHTLQRFSSAWGTDARTAVAQATQAEDQASQCSLLSSSIAAGEETSACPVPPDRPPLYLDDTLDSIMDTCDTSSACSSSVPLQQRCSPLLPDSVTQRVAWDEASQTRSPVAMSFRNDDAIQSTVSSATAPVAQVVEATSKTEYALSVANSEPNVSEPPPRVSASLRDSERLPLSQIMGANGTASMLGASGSPFAHRDHLPSQPHIVTGSAMDGSNLNTPAAMGVAWGTPRSFTCGVSEESASSTSAIQRTPTGNSPLPGAMHLAGLLNEAEALLRETAMTAALASAAANKHDPLIDEILAGTRGTLTGVPGEGAQNCIPVVSDAMLSTCNGARSVNATASEHIAEPSKLYSTNIDAATTGRDVRITESFDDKVCFQSHAVAGIRAQQPQTTAGVSSSMSLAVPAVDLHGAGVEQWVSDGRRWGGADLGVQLEEICRELDEVVGLGTARLGEDSGRHLVETCEV